MRRKKGFTLIELLVVISVVALLTSILAPALSSVKEQARALVCMTHQRDLTLSWNTYAVANNGLICSSYNYYGDNYSQEFADRSSWVWAAWSDDLNLPSIENPNSGKSHLWTVTRDEKIAGIKKGALWPYSDDIDIYRCPSDQNSFEHVRSYVIADNMNGKKPYIDSSANWKIFKRIENVPRPSESYVFIEESDPRSYNMDSFLVNVDGGSWWDPLAVWHRGSSSFSFADGHVEQRKWSKETEKEFNIADQPDGWYYYDWQWVPVSDSAIDDYNWMQAGWAR